jgi:hypothetical protein
MEGSLRESLEPGHIAAAVYEVNKSQTVVIGVYGVSEKNDCSSADLIQEVSNIARELKYLYNTKHVIVAGDFNVVGLSSANSNDHCIRKTRTSGKLHLLLKQHNLTDLAIASKNNHTLGTGGTVTSHPGST